MFPRRTVVSRQGRRYEYVQLVESVRRRTDGKPVHRVVANLGAFDPVLFENLQAAFEASRRGQRLSVVAGVERRGGAGKPQANLRYLDVAVADAMWREWGLDRMMEELMPAGGREESLGKVVESLVIQRLVSPDSKLAAVRWVPKTGLPEWLGLSVRRFNNTRVHRALEELDLVSHAVMERLAGRYQDRRGAFAALFLDVTDTWFEGRGPEIAKRGKTKEGFVRRKVGIVMLCNERGYPLRWEVIRGNETDGEAMTEMVRSASLYQWAREAPWVMDRAMGDSAHIRVMASMGLRFVVGLKAPEFPKYAARLSWAMNDGWSVEGEEAEKVAREGGRRAEAWGMKKVDETMFVMDLGEVTLGTAEEGGEWGVGGGGMDRNAWALKAARMAQVFVGRRGGSTFATVGMRLGIKKGLLHKYRKLLKLSEDIQEAILQGRTAGRPLEPLLKIATISDHHEQQVQFETWLRSTVPTRPRAQGAAFHGARVPEQRVEALPSKVRVVAYFNPERFATERLHATEKIRQIQAWLAGINARLASGHSRRSQAMVLAEIDRRLHREDMVGLFQVNTKEAEDHQSFQVSWTLDEDEWTRRRRYDGFFVLVAHPDLPHTAEDLCRLYRRKDRIEKDFQVIKEVVELRPIRHRTEPKIRAHVTLCTLALLLERTLSEKLAPTYSAARALEILGTCHLNRYQSKHGPAVYLLTEPDFEQRALLRRLRLLHLADDDSIAQRISPR